MKISRCLLISLLVVCLLMPALAQEAPGPLTVDELRAFSQSLVERAIADGGGVVQSEEGFMVEGIGYAIYLSSEDLSADSVLSAADINMGSLHVEGFTGPRGVGASSSLKELLAAYPNDNPTLEGSATGAVLYIFGQLPGDVAIGQVLRDGQDVQLVDHLLLTPSEKGYTLQGIQYLLQHDSVVNIRLMRGLEGISVEEAHKVVEDAAALQEQQGHFSYDQVDPSELTREDLSFAGMDFPDMTPETAQARLGEAVHDERVKDSNGDEIRTMQWEGVEIAFIYSAAGEFKRADRITVTNIDLEGPRGMRVGARLSQVLGRFPHQGEPSMQSATLYGDPQGAQAPFGRLEVSNATARLYLGVQVEGAQVLVSALFEGDVLVEMSAGY